MRKFVFAVVLLLTILFVISRFAEVENIVHTLQRGNLLFILAACALEVLFYVNISSCFKVIYRMLGMNEGRLRLFQLAVAASFINVIAPSGGVSGIAVFISDAKDQGHASGKVTVAGALYLLYDYSAFLCTLVLGLIVLVRRNHLGWAEVVASILFFLLSAAIAALLYLGLRSSKLLGRVLVWLARQGNRIMYSLIHKTPFSEGSAQLFADEIGEGLTALRAKRQKPIDLLLPMIWTLANKAVSILILLCSFLSFDVPFSAGTLVAGYSIAFLFLIISPTPSGIGIVEGVMALTLTSLRVPLEASAIVTLVYRAVTFWLPLGGGLAIFRRLANPFGENARG